jgi:nucleoside-diphosphate-sugar epimerase
MPSPAAAALSICFMNTVLVTGGAGYKGCVLVPKLLEAGWQVVVYDLMLFGQDGLPSHPNLKVIKGDIRDPAAYAAAVSGCDSVIHMACISNDPSFDLDPSLSRTINFECFEPLVQASKAAGVKRFVYVSSSSVYGVSDSPEVTEEHPLVPLTDYNKFKGLCEPLLFRHQSADFTCVTIRPATVCGYSPRMRFDLTVNILTNHAYHRGTITVFGGDQQRPNIHIDDVCELYVALLSMPKEKIAGEIFNAGFENQTVNQLAGIAKKIVEEEFPEKRPIQIVRTSTNDPRSYRITSRKITEKLGWRPKRDIEDAVRDLCRAFREGRFPSDTLKDESFINVKTVMKLGLK